MTIDEIKALSHWDDIPGHPVEDWQLEVEDGDTRLGYKDWAINRIETGEDPEEDDDE